MKSAFAILAVVASVSAHSTWQQMWVGSTDMAAKCARTVRDNNPITGLNSADMFCGRGPAKSDGICEVDGMLTEQRLSE
jgi:cellulase